MGNILKIFILIIIISVTINIGVADSYDRNPTAFPGNPSYTIFSYSDNPVVNQGDNVSISLYVSGAGDVDFNKLRVSIPPYIVKNNKINMIYLSYFKKDNEIVRTPLSKFEDSQFTVVLFKESFMAGSEGLDNIGESFLYEPKDGKRYTPFTFDFKVADDAPAGDHKISTILFYKNGSQWYMSEKNITIHIRYWYEKEGFYIASSILIFLNLIAISINIFKFFNAHATNTKTNDVSEPQANLIR